MFDLVGSWKMNLNSLIKIKQRKKKIKQYSISVMIAIAGRFTL